MVFCSGTSNVRTCPCHTNATYVWIVCLKSAEFDTCTWYSKYTVIYYHAYSTGCATRFDSNPRHNQTNLFRLYSQALDKWVDRTLSPKPSSSSALLANRLQDRIPIHSCTNQIFILTMPDVTYRQLHTWTCK